MVMMRIAISITNKEESATATTTVMAAPLSRVRDAGQARAQFPLPVQKKKLERQFGCLKERHNSKEISVRWADYKAFDIVRRKDLGGD